MSILIIACAERYGLIIADTRRIIGRDNSSNCFEISDDTVKIRQLGDNLAIGAAGDGTIVIK